MLRHNLYQSAYHQLSPTHHALIYHFQNLPKNSNERPGLVHRIDKDTSGLLVVAKTEFAMANLASQFFNRTTERLYLALVWGSVIEEEGTITGHVGRSLKNRLQMDVFPDGEFGKHAVTHYKVVERFSYVTRTIRSRKAKIDST